MKEVKRKLRLEKLEFPDDLIIKIFELLSKNKITKKKHISINRTFLQGELIEDIYMEYKPISDSEFENHNNRNT